MYLNLAGTWQIKLNTDKEMQSGSIQIPGILQAQGYGNEITINTPWVSGLHDREWWKREEYQYAQKDGVNVPFLAQPPRHFTGKAYYEKKITIPETLQENWYLYIEITHWKTTVYVDGVQIGEDCSLCTAHKLYCGKLQKGEHTILLEIDNSMQYPYRPDGHGVSDALGATWNGMAGEVALLTETELQEKDRQRKAYAKKHLREIEIVQGKFYVDGKPEYFRGTHFGGEYPITGYPVTDKAWWLEKMRIVKSWGLNFIRCHSYCPPEAAFAAADEEGIYLQPECDMWNHFEEGILMLDVLKKETRRILEAFGQHPSFVLFSPTNEPSGHWYHVLREWVSETKEYDRLLWGGNRRVYTAESGWFYEVEPAKIKGVDYLYFHRSAYGPYLGGTIRGPLGWKGRNYEPSLGKIDKPVICHELGQWCAYPDFSVRKKFTGYLHGGNYEVFYENCKAHGLLSLNSQFVYNSGRNQLRLYKEDIEANLRTKGIYGFELLDLHDYLGQGTSVVGMLDAFWEEKSYVKPEEFRHFCGETVLLAAFPKYVYHTQEAIEVPLSICHFGRKSYDNVVIKWKISTDKEILLKGKIKTDSILPGENKDLGIVKPDMDAIKEYVKAYGHQQLTFTLQLEEVTENSWQLYVFDADRECVQEDILFTQEWMEAKAALKEGRKVIFSPYLSDLSYECPPLSIKNVFWNAQLGPTWGRSLGMIADKESRLFSYFPTQESGGWQWEDILQHARGFYMQGSLAKIQPLVRVIDDWNRNLSLALAFEAKVEKGSLLFVSADLSGNADERVAAHAWKKALKQYALSDAFAPAERIEVQDIEKNLFPLLRMEQLTEQIAFTAEKVWNEKALVQANPNLVTVMEKEDFPLEILITLHKKVEVKGMLYVPDQKERIRAAYPEKTVWQVWNDEKQEWEEKDVVRLPNSSLSFDINFDAPVLTDKIKVIILSCYGEKRKEDWEEYTEGYRYVREETKAIVRIAGLHVICEEEALHNNFLFWDAKQKSTTKEIEA